MPELMEIAGLFIYAYLVGAVPTAYIVGKLVKGIDLRQYGSGNVGGTNLAQHVGRGWFVPVVLLEILVKGASPVLIGHYVLGLDRASHTLVAGPLLAVAGHNWSVFLKFQGGRGLAVVLGGLAALAPVLAVAFFAVSLAGWVVTRSAGLWVLLSLMLLPLWSVVAGLQSVVTWYCVGIVILVVAKRLLSNWTPLPGGLPKKKALFNRLVRDRDVDNRADWVRRTP